MSVSSICVSSVLEQKTISMSLEFAISRSFRKSHAGCCIVCLVLRISGCCSLKLGPRAFILEDLKSSVCQLKAAALALWKLRDGQKIKNKDTEDCEELWIDCFNTYFKCEMWVKILIVLFLTGPHSVRNPQGLLRSTNKLFPLGASENEKRMKRNTLIKCSANLFPAVIHAAYSVHSAPSSDS